MFNGSPRPEPITTKGKALEIENDNPEVEGIAGHEFICPQCGLVANRFAGLASGICAEHGEHVRIVINRW